MSPFLADVAASLAVGLLIGGLEVKRHLNATGGIHWWFKVRLAIQDRLDRRRDAKIWGRR